MVDARTISIIGDETAGEALWRAAQIMRERPYVTRDEAITLALAHMEADNKVLVLIEK